MKLAWEETKIEVIMFDKNNVIVTSGDVGDDFNTPWDDIDNW